MSAPRIYLETTMFSYYHEDRPQAEYQEHKAQVRRVFDLIRSGAYEPYTSVLATGEIDNEQNPGKQEKMWRLIEECGVRLLEMTADVERLAALYIQEEAVSPAFEMGVAHIAITAANGLDFIVSLNFRHITRPWTIDRVRRVNIREGYKAIGIYKPAEVLEL